MYALGRIFKFLRRYFQFYMSEEGHKYYLGEYVQFYMLEEGHKHYLGDIRPANPSSRSIPGDKIHFIDEMCLVLFFTCIHIFCTFF
jgi:hypothetical protein